MHADPKITRRRFLQKSAIGLGATLLVCSGTGLALNAPKIELIETTFDGSTNMNNKILVAYASKCGSTAQVAEAIGKTLSEKGLAADVKPLDLVNGLDGYNGVVLGSAIRYGSWLPAAASFVKNNADALKQKPLAYFTVGSTLFDDTPENRAAVATYTAPQKALVPPVSAADFAGVFDPKKVSFAERLLARAVKTPEGDFRNWDAIRAWAASLVSLFAN